MTDLVPAFYINGLRVDDYPFSVVRGDGGLELGVGANVMTVIDSLMRDGELVVSDKTSNRTLMLPLYVEGADLAELAENEKTLILECEKAAGTFTLDPGDGYGPATVFDTFKIQATHVRNDNEEAALLRRWNLLIPAYPFSRPADKTTVTFEPGAGTLTELDDGSSAADWVGSTATATTWLGEDAIRFVYGALTTAAYPVPFSWTGAPTAAAYVALPVAGDTDSIANARLAGASPLTIAFDSGWTVFYFANPGVGPLSFEVDVASASGTSQTFYARGMYSAASLPASGSFVADIGGSVRTTGGITVSRASGLTNLFVFCDPALLSSGYSPAVPGSWPQAPQGDYAFWLEVASLSSPPALGDVIELSIEGESGATQLLRTRYDGSAAWVPVGLANLGGLRNGTVGTLTLTTEVDGVPDVGADYRMFRRKDGETALTYFRGPASGTTEEVIIDIPSLEHEHGGVWADGIDALDRCPIWEYPDVTPPTAALCVLATATTGMTVTFEAYTRHHTYVALEAS